MAHFRSRNASEEVECILRCVHIDPHIHFSLNVLLYGSVWRWGVRTERVAGV
jgi:hypothetical protein